MEGNAAALTAELQEHIASCAACAEVAREIRATWSLLGKYRALEPQPDYKERFHARLRSVKSKPIRRAPTWPAWRWVALAAGSAVIVVVLAGRMVTPPEQPVEYGINPADRWDETFLDELERALRNSDSDYLREYDSWPAGYLEGSETMPRERPAGKGQRAKGEYRHGNA